MQASLASFKKRPFAALLDLRAVPMQAVQAGFSEMYHDGDSEIMGQAPPPDTDALWFYLQNHVYALIQKKTSSNDTPLSQEDTGLVLEYFEQGMVAAVRMMYYMLMICTREARHGSFVGHVASYLEDNCPVMAEFLETLCHGGSESTLMHWDFPKDFPLAFYVRAIEFFYFYGDWSSSFGGKMWGSVNYVWRQFVEGQISAEQLLDTGFTLAHNTGPIFNKGHFYSNQTSSFAHILDVQHAGYIPNYVYAGQSGVTTEMGEYLKRALHLQENHELTDSYPQPSSKPFEQHIEKPSSYDWALDGLTIEYVPPLGHIEIMGVKVPIVERKDG